MRNIYYIGGSPCSGKSTVAELLAKKYNYYYFKVDDFLEDYTKKGANKDFEICSKQCNLSPEEIWMRDPVIQCKEELTFYEEIFAFPMEDLARVEAQAIITEGAAYLPKLMNQSGILKENYIAIVPTKKFQVTHYKQREWVPYVLEGCNDKEAAFHNWMDRDALFAKEVEKQCMDLGYHCIVNDGTISFDSMIERIEKHFKFQI